jgi:hypothetical protein
MSEIYVTQAADSQVSCVQSAKLGQAYRSCRPAASPPIADAVPPPAAVQAGRLRVVSRTQFRTLYRTATEYSNGVLSRRMWRIWRGNVARE